MPAQLSLGCLMFLVTSAAVIGISATSQFLGFGHGASAHEAFFDQGSKRFFAADFTAKQGRSFGSAWLYAYLVPS